MFRIFGRIMVITRCNCILTTNFTLQPFGRQFTNHRSPITTSLSNSFHHSTFPLFSYSFIPQFIFSINPYNYVVTYPPHNFQQSSYSPLPTLSLHYYSISIKLNDKGSQELNESVRYNTQLMHPPDFSYYFKHIKTTSVFTSEKENLFHFFNYLISKGYDHEAAELIDYMLTNEILATPV